MSKIFNELCSKWVLYKEFLSKTLPEIIAREENVYGMVIECYSIAGDIEEFPFIIYAIDNDREMDDTVDFHYDIDGLGDEELQKIVQPLEEFIYDDEDELQRSIVKFFNIVANELELPENVLFIFRDDDDYISLRTLEIMNIVEH